MPNLELNDQNLPDRQLSTSTDAFYVGTPSPIPMEAGMSILKSGLEKVRAQFSSETSQKNPELSSL